MNLSQLTTAFDGKRLVTLDLGGQPGWDAQHIGDILEFSGRGRRLVKKLRSEWLNEFLHGHDFMKIDGCLVLLKPGLDMVCSRSSKPIAKRLRQHVVDEVIPALHQPAGPPFVIRESVSPLVERERRLRDKLELEDRRFRTGTLRHAARVLRDLGRIDDEEFVLCEATAVEIALGVLPTALGGGA